MTYGPIDQFVYWAQSMEQAHQLIDGVRRRDPEFPDFKRRLDEAVRITFKAEIDLWGSKSITCRELEQLFWLRQDALELLEEDI